MGIFNTKKFVTEENQAKKDYKIKLEEFKETKSLIKSVESFMKKINEEIKFLEKSKESNKLVNKDQFIVSLNALRESYKLELRNLERISLDYQQSIEDLKEKIESFKI